MTNMTRRNKLLMALVLMTGCAAQPVATVDASETAMRSDAQACALAIAPAPQPDRQRLDADAIRVANWNIQKGGDPAWADDLNALDASADLVILQEASPAIVNDLELASGHHRAFAEGFRWRGRATGVLTLSRAEPVAECDLVAREPWLGTRKATLVTEYGLTGTSQTLLVINIHGVNFSLGARELKAQIADAETVIAAHPGPVLFSGDFNTWRGGRAALLDELAERHGLAAPAYDADHRKRFMGWPLDHIYTRGLVPVAATTHDIESSDHNPMTVEFRLDDDPLALVASP